MIAYDLPDKSAITLGPTTLKFMCTYISDKSLLSMLHVFVTRPAKINHVVA